jgi:hypothetical protein
MKFHPHSSPRSTTTTCLALTLLALTGCSAIQVKLGLRVSLPKTPVASIEASLPTNPGIAPGQKNPLVVEVTQPDGKVLVTSGPASPRGATADPVRMGGTVATVTTDTAPLLQQTPAAPLW